MEFFKFKLFFTTQKIKTSQKTCFGNLGIIIKIEKVNFIVSVKIPSEINDPINEGKKMQPQKKSLHFYFKTRN